MERKDKACWNCLLYKIFYTKGFCHFNREKNGYCTKHEKILDKNNLCNFWIPNNPKISTRKKVAIRKLNEISESLIEIRQILFECKEYF